MSTKKKHQPFKYELKKAVELTQHAEISQNYYKLIKQHTEQLKKDKEIIFIDLEGKEERMTADAAQEKCMVTADPDTTVDNSFILRDKKSYDLYRREGTVDGVATYRQINFEEMLKEKVEGGAEVVGEKPAEEEQPIPDDMKEGRYYKEAIDDGVDVLPEAVLKTPSPRGLNPHALHIDDSPIQFATTSATKAEILKKNNLVEGDLSEEEWERPVTSGEMMSSKHMDKVDPKYLHKLYARNEYQSRVIGAGKQAQALKDNGVVGAALDVMMEHAEKMANIRNEIEGNVVFTGKEGIHDVGRGLTEPVIGGDPIPLKVSTKEETKAEILKKFNLEESDISDADWARMLSPNEIAGIECSDEKNQNMIQARVEYQNHAMAIIRKQEEGYPILFDTHTIATLTEYAKIMDDARKRNDSNIAFMFYSANEEANNSNKGGFYNAESGSWVDCLEATVYDVKPEVRPESTGDDGLFITVPKHPRNDIVTVDGMACNDADDASFSLPA